MTVGTNPHWVAAKLVNMCDATHRHEPNTGNTKENNNEHIFMDEVRSTIDDDAKQARGMVNLTSVEDVEEHIWWKTETKSEKKDHV